MKTETELLKEVETNKIHLVNTEDGHYKFWTLEKVKNVYEASYGKIGDSGKTTNYNSHEISKKIREKIKKGYEYKSEEDYMTLVFEGGMPKTSSTPSFWNVVTLDFAEKNDFHGDIIDVAQYDHFDAGKGNVEIVETTIDELAKKKVYPVCGCEDDFKRASKKFGKSKIRTCISNLGSEGLMCSSCEIFVNSEAEGEEIGDKVEMRFDDGYNGGTGAYPRWCYFESE